MIEWILDPRMNFGTDFVTKLRKLCEHYFPVNPLMYTKLKTYSYSTHLSTVQHLLTVVYMHAD